MVFDPLMEKVWTDERNKMSIELVKAELCVSINYGMNCLEFAQYLDQPELSKLVHAAMRSKKNSFANKKTTL